MSKYLDCCEVAKIVRKELKKAFPKQKFSVRSSKYSGGSSIDVGWLDDPSEKEVNGVIGHYHGATFDGSIDLKSYHDSTHEGESVHFGNDYIFTKRSFSTEFMQEKHLQYAKEWPDSARSMNVREYEYSKEAYMHSDNGAKLQHFYRWMQEQEGEVCT